MNMDMIPRLRIFLPSLCHMANHRVQGNVFPACVCLVKWEGPLSWLGVGEQRVATCQFADYEYWSDHCSIGLYTGF